MSINGWTFHEGHGGKIDPDTKLSTCLHLVKDQISDLGEEVKALAVGYDTAIHAAIAS